MFYAKILLNAKLLYKIEGKRNLNSNNTLVNEKFKFLEK